MRTNIKALGFPLTEALLQHTERQLHFALSRSTTRIKSVIVRLGDLNGPRGGEDKFCRIQVHTEHGQSVIVEGTGADIYVVVNRVAERTGRNVIKRLSRQHEGVRRSRLEREKQSNVTDADLISEQEHVSSENPAPPAGSLGGRARNVNERRV